MKFLNFVGIAAFIYAFFLSGPEIEGHFFPVLKEFNVVGKVKVDNNVIIEADVLKVRNCQYVPPWRAKAASGRMLQIIHEEVDAANWSKGAVRTRIKVMNVGQESFTLTAEHKCHPGWTVFSKLGDIG